MRARPPLSPPNSRRIENLDYHNTEGLMEAFLALMVGFIAMIILAAICAAGIL